MTAAANKSINERLSIMSYHDTTIQVNINIVRYCAPCACFAMFEWLSILFIIDKSVAASNGTTSYFEKLNCIDKTDMLMLRNIFTVFKINSFYYRIAAMSPLEVW